MSLPSAARLPRRPARGRRGALLPTIVVVVALLFALGLAANIWTEVLWFDQLTVRQVYTTRLGTQVVLFLVGGVLMAAAVATSMNLAYRSRPVYAPVDERQQSLDRYRESLEPLRRLVLIALPAGLALFAGSAAAAQWTTVQMWMNGASFGADDPEFGMDVGFYVFTLPFLRFVVSFVMAVLVLSLLVGAATHYLYGGLRIQGRGPRTTGVARVHLAVLLGLLLLAQGASYWLDRYSQLLDVGDLITGASYTGVQAVIPARSILAVIAVLVAVLFFATAGRGSWRLPAYGIALMVISAIAIGGIFPAALQTIRVRPSQSTLELPYLDRNIEATRTAYGLDEVEVQDYEPASEPERGALSGNSDAVTTASLRILDPQLVSPAFRQLQRNRTFYDFPDSLDVDRYDIDGQSRDTVIAVRELDQAGVPASQRNWLTDHAIYTHGFGVVAAYGNQRTDEGEPAFFQSGIPSVGALDVKEPRIYFGERSPEFSIVGAPSSDDPRELDFPTDEAGSTGQANTTFSGNGGPRVGGLLNQLLYALKFQDQNILLSDAVNSESQIMYDRDPRDRVQKVAPFLTLDGDPYPAVVDGKVVWILDGYTTSENYPYSDRQALGDATTDSVTTQSTAVVAVQGEVNYIRNSVKATVDAYDGSVSLYQWDEDDPILQTWMRIFPGLVKPTSDISAGLMSHLRYPEDLFKVQRALLSRYHVQDASDFFGGSDYWSVPPDPTGDAGENVDQPPYYLTLQMPGQDAPSFSLTSTYIPRTNADQGTSNVLTGFLAVDADAGDEAGVRAPGYGTLRLLELPRNNVASGPGQVQNDFNSDPVAQDTLNRLRIGNSAVTSGNLLSLPVAGGLLYVQPVYVQSQTETSFPLLRYVLASFGETIGFAPTLDEALDQVFGGDSGANAGDAGSEPVPGDPGSGGTGTPDAGDAEQRLDQALTDANQAIQTGQTALAAGDFAAYGAAQSQLQDALTRAIDARAEIDGTSPTTTDGATPSPSATPTP